MEVKPYNQEAGSKKHQVEEMFDNISGNYDFLNHFLSLGIDKSWRRKAIALLKNWQPEHVLDVACGTGDFSIECLKISPKKITGIDLSSKMLEVAKAKVKNKGIENIDLLQGDSENLPFADDTFDAITVAFGVRNFENLEIGLKEMKRVLKKDQPLIILEFSKPEKFPFRQFYSFYFTFVLPLVGRIFSKDKRAYSYLPESVHAFPHGREMISILEKCGYKQIDSRSLTFGVATIYSAISS